MEDESAGFTIFNDGFYNEEGKRTEYCYEDYCIVYENAHCFLSRHWEEEKKGEWSLTIVRKSSQKNT
ncbi:hypothetical protein PRIPAC_83016 [Pristionchus pacificus]|uniref:Uncharacterized protein n=1 Tax=Pristionchus pacificus TaxID=54126 RepID=A0A2A6C2H4_PRIPA|nr:hypothetical protein PRIPAC_83016 [Pristionchus pacificus]|eukprot:PDM72231.1 hypothetical protein PRIPAC_38665 [Pristionchus pacificus]